MPAARPLDRLREIGVMLGRPDSRRLMGAMTAADRRRRATATPAAVRRVMIVEVPAGALQEPAAVVRRASPAARLAVVAEAAQSGVLPAGTVLRHVAAVAERVVMDRRIARPVVRVRRVGAVVERRQAFAMASGVIEVAPA